MKPVARLHIIKQREYRKSGCRGPPTGHQRIGNPSIGYNPNIGGGVGEMYLYHVLYSFNYPSSLHFSIC